MITLLMWFDLMWSDFLLSNKRWFNPSFMCLNKGEQYGPILHSHYYISPVWEQGCGSELSTWQVTRPLESTSSVLKCPVSMVKGGVKCLQVNKYLLLLVVSCSSVRGGSDLHQLSRGIKWSFLSFSLTDVGQNRKEAAVVKVPQSSSELLLSCLSSEDVSVSLTGLCWIPEAVMYLIHTLLCLRLQLLE